MPSPLCFFRSIWRSLLCGAFVSGHEFEIDPGDTPNNVLVLRCRDCGERSIGWGWEPQEKGEER